MGACTKFCENTNDCTCDSLTGEITFHCQKASDPVLGYTHRPVLVNGVYECRAYDCGSTCINFIDFIDFIETPIPNAGCYGDGTINSVGTCRCDTFGTAVNDENSLFTGGQYVKYDDRNG